MYRLLKFLRGLDGVLNCFSFGSVHHVAIDGSGICARDILIRITEAGFRDCEVREIRPGIEDCFMNLAGQDANNGNVLRK